MKLIAFGCLCLVASSLALTIRNGTLREATKWSEDVCSGNFCYCSQMQSPISVDETPQLITLVYADAITDVIYSSYLQPLFEGRTNPDGTQIGATLYVPHEYTDYERVNNLYNLGLEIAIHSISRNSLDSYWQEASLETLIDEFEGQREILARFANIPIEDVIGAKMPNLVMLGNRIFEAYGASGIEYDNSWTARSTDRYFPYTLDYLSSQSCLIGTCPDEAFPGTWELPIVGLVGNDGIECNSLQGCSISGTEDEVSAWLMDQFTRVYEDNRAPMTLVLSSGWFTASTANLSALNTFLDQLRNYDDVFIVSHRQVVDWMMNPVEATSFKTDDYYRDENCVARSCALAKDDETRYMKSCVACPSKYPWVGNPLGS